MGNQRAFAENQPYDALLDISDHRSAIEDIWLTPSVVGVWLPGLFFQRIEPAGEDDCWGWNGTIDKAGYARFGDGRYGTVYAHLLLWRHLNGEVGEGNEIDHQCFNRSCMNPAHHRELTLAENRSHRDPSRRKLHCPKGHERSPLPCGTWVCRQCVKDATRVWRERKAS